MKRKVLVLFAFLLFSNCKLFSQPTTITWQGKLLGASGNAITQNNVAMTFAMFDASTAGTQLWPTSGVVTKTVDVDQGLYSVQLGTGSGDDISFTAAMFDGKTPWLEVKVGTETLPRTEVTNVPFALISNELSASGWENPGEIGKTTPNTGKFTSLETANLKITDGASDGNVLTSDAEGNASWTTPYTGLTNFTESNYAYDSKTGVKFQAANAATDVDFIISPKGYGAILAQQPDGTTAGGNNRGYGAVDLQLGRNVAAQVASGNYSVTMGVNNTAISNYSVAMGADNTASGNGGSIALGYWNTASGQRSIALGMQTIASGPYATTLGYQTTASGPFALAMGYSSDATSIYSVAIGKDATTSNDYAVAIGNNPSASGYASLAMGDYTTASGKISTAMGNRTTAPSGYETVFGRYNSDYTPSSTTEWIATDRLFVVGNGATDVAKSNALTILKNANTTIGGSLTINGNGTNTGFTFPTGRGTSGQVLTSDGSGGISWSSPSGGTVTGVSGTAPIVSSGGTAPVISINAATTSTAGSMSAADKTKLDGVISSQWTTSGTNIYYNSGNVGIGTTATNSNLTFSNSIGNGFDDWSDYKMLLFTDATPQQSYGLGIKGNTLAFNSDRDYDFDQDGSTVMTIQEGKVGIGTTSPLGLLDLGTSISNRKIILYSSADNDHQFTGFGLNADALRFQLASTSGNFKFYGATSNTTSDELFRIQGDGDVVVQGQIKNITEPTDANDAATKAYVDALLSRIEELELLYGGFVDSRDGNHYKIVKIGDQIWMAENLKYLPEVVGASTGSATDAYYYVYGYDGTNTNDAKATANYTTYGVLYNWPAAMAGSASSTANPSGVQGICPEGWHLPGAAEWTELTDYLGGSGIAGGKLKEAGLTHWQSPNTNATNNVGFTALPAGVRDNVFLFFSIGYLNCLWSATEDSSTEAWHISINYNSDNANSEPDVKQNGYSVRCVRD